MLVKKDVPAHVKDVIAAVPATPAGVAAGGVLARLTNKLFGRSGKSAEPALAADAQAAAPALDAQPQEPPLQTGLADEGVAFAAMDPSWYVEPGTSPKVSDAPKPGWFGSPTASTSSEPGIGSLFSKSPAATETPVVRGPSLSAMGSGALGGLGALGVGLGLAGGGGGSSGSPAAPPAPTTTIKVVDGPIRDARLYSDMNDNGVYDAGIDKLVGTTDANGSLSLASASLGSHGLLAVGGTNSNGMPNASTLSLLAPTDKTAPLVVVSPLTSLVSEVYLQSQQSEHKLSVSQAEGAVKLALGIDTGSASLSSMDPTASGDSALKLLKVGAVLVSLSAVTLSPNASSQDTIAGYILAQAPTDGSLLTQLTTSEGLQTVFASSLDALSPADRSSALVTLGTLEDNHTSMMAARDSTTLASTQIAKPQIIGLVQDTGPSASDNITSLALLTVSSLGGVTQLSVNYGSTWVDASSFVPADGRLTVIARSNYGTNSDGKLIVSGNSEPFTFTLHSTVPPAPTIALTHDTAVATDHISSDGRFAVTATQVAGALVQYSTDGRIWNEALSTQDLANLALDGKHTVYVRQIVQDSGLSSAVKRLDFTLDTRISAGTAYVVSADDTGSSSNDGFTTNSQARLAGDTDPYNTVALTLPGGVRFTVMANSLGHWVLDPIDNYYNLDDGAANIALRISDAAGNSVNSTLPITVDTQVDLGAAFIVGTTEDSAVTRNLTPTLSGNTTEMGASVEVSLEIPDANGDIVQTLIFRTTTDAQGHWSVVLDTPDHTGLVVPAEVEFYDYSPQITITDLAGNTDYSNLADFTLTLGPEPAIGGLDAASDTGAANNDGITSNTMPVFSGTALAGAIVTVLIDDVEVATAVVGGNGRWSCQALQPLEDGEYQLSLAVSMTRGQSSGTTVGEPVLLVIDSTPPDSDSVVPNATASEGNFGTGTDGVMYFNADSLNSDTPLTFSGTADLGATVDLYIADTLVGTVTASIDDGSWYFDWDGSVDGSLLSDGSYTAAVVVTDLAGNVSDLLPAADGDLAFVIDTAAPDTSALTALLADGLQTGADPDTGDAYTNQTDISLAGTADPLATLVVTVDGQDYDVSADEEGAWTLDLSGLADGNYTVSVVTKNLAGNASDPVELLIFNVDTVPEYFSGSAEDGYSPVTGTHIALVVGTDTDVDINPFEALADHVAPGTDFDYVDNVEVLGSLPDGLELGDDGHITGTPTAAGQTWLAVHTFDFAGNESITNLQLVVAQSAVEPTAASVTVSGALAKQYSASDDPNTITITSTAGVVVFAAGGDDLIKIGTKATVPSTDVPFARIDGGDGIDTVSFLYMGESIDLSVFNQPDGGVLEHVEKFMLAGGNGTESSISLTAADVFRLHSDATDANGNALLVLSGASSSSNQYLSATLSDFTQVGSSNSFTITGDAATRSSTGNYSKFYGSYADDQGTHDLTVLVQGYFVLG